MRKLTMATSLATILVGFSAWAIPPKILISELPDLKQEQQHSVTSKRITDLFTRTHYHRFVLDDAFSERIFERYLSLLDYRRNVLTQADVDGFQKYADDFDDMLKTGNLTEAYTMYDLVQNRRYEGFVYALSLLDNKMDFTKANDQYQFDREDAKWPKNTNEIHELWRQRVKYDALNLKLTDKKWDEIVEILSKRYNNALKRLTQTNSEDVFQIVMNSFARTIEAHTSYLSPRNAERFQQEMNLKLEGIGAVLQAEDDYTMIRSLVNGGPAAKSEQLSDGDKIIGVGQDGEKIVDVIGWRLDDVVDLIKGPKGTKVTLQILQKKAGSSAKPLDVVITRDTIRLEDRAASSKVIEGDVGQYKNRKIGVIDIPGFYMNLSRDVSKELAKLKAEKVEGIIIDLRGNGGGALTEATLLTGLFIQKGPVVQVRYASGQVVQNKDENNAVTYDGPLTVMVDRYSASASEIFAAALQDYGRALIVGEATFGKGTVQQHKGLERIYDMYDKPIGYVQYTIAKFYRINGGSTQLKGVTPDIMFPSALKPGEFGEAEQENALPWDQVPVADYKKVDDISPALIKRLTAKYESRIKTNVEFGYIAQDIADYRKRRDEKSVSLVESERLAKQKDIDSKSLTRANERRLVEGKKPFADLDELAKLDDKEDKSDPLLEQTADITLDLVDASKKKH
ncbi:carboxy terminal-processing peptidase [Parashewanella spongiae]|uniref:Carboxy terminal-processing peptidase n=1 Tax=Parashewanella spongiae TaxID=342950 RepID=A0A3A6U8H7_9GAMM|nr:carboxy terminal-processing peptidase [Parashewanella spongiae]MCL1078484.1 carboxy terminal-processing peptidase [Parashewanella spongiae]RJY14667.1 carboxy terminal-processing peptidase [Parashewanella spongiae]